MVKYNPSIFELECFLQLLIGFPAGLYPITLQMSLVSSQTILRQMKRLKKKRRKGSKNYLETERDISQPSIPSDRQSYLAFDFYTANWTFYCVSKLADKNLANLDILVSDRKILYIFEELLGAPNMVPLRLTVEELRQLTDQYYSRRK